MLEIRMLIKFCSAGKSLITRVIKYVIGKKDANGHDRPRVVVLRGDPKSAIDVGMTLKFKTKYSSALIAFHRDDDRPTVEQIDEVLDEFEKLMFAGLDKNRFSYLAVLHGEDGGGCHIHIIVNKIDLQSGKHFNPARPGWQYLFDPLRDYFNYRYGWARPDDPTRQRYLQPGRMASVLKHVPSDKRFTQAHLKQELHNLLLERIIQGQIHNRQEMFQQLIEMNYEITRKGKDYITVVDIQTGIKMRLTGKIYHEQEYTNELKRALRAVEENESDRQSNVGGHDQKKANYSYEEYLERYKNKAASNLKRYGQTLEFNDTFKEKNKRKSSVSNSKFDALVDNNVSISNWTNSLSAQTDERNNGKSESNIESSKDSTIPNSDQRNQRGAVSDIAHRESKYISIWESIGHQIIKLVGNKYESIRDRVIKRVGTIVSSICAGTKRNERANRAIESACHQVDECLPEIEKDIGELNYKKSRYKNTESSIKLGF